MNKISSKTKLTLIFLTFISMILSFFIFKQYPLEFTFNLLIFLVFASITEAFVIPTPNTGGVTLTFGIVLSVAILFGPSAGLLCSATCILLSVYKVNGKIKHIFNIELYKTLGNLNGYIISTGLSSIFFIYINNGVEFNNQSILYMFIATLLYLAIDIVIISYLIMLTSKYNTAEIFKESFRDIIPNFLGISTLSIIIVLSYLRVGIEMVVILFFPYMLIRYSFQLVYDMKENYLSTIKALSFALEEKDPYTKGHTERVERYSLILAGAMGVTKVELQQLQYAAIFHDIGKIGVDDQVLNKPGKLTPDEFDLIKEHPIKGVHILGEVKFLAKATKIMEAHHEYYDGSGYPKGLKDGEILLESKIITIADIFDAVTTDRPYRKAMTNEEAIAIIKDESGKKLDPHIVAKFLELYEKGRFLV